MANPEGSGVAIDIGCGGGYTATLFENYYRTVAVDLSEEGLKLCQRRGLSRLCRVDMGRFSLPFKTESFDLVLALDVIEHMEDDVGALRECRRILKTGGSLVVTVPAFMWLWSPWDDALGHRRRYTVSTFARALEKADLPVERLTYMFSFILPAAASFRAVKRLFQKNSLEYTSDFIRLPEILNLGLIRLGRIEQWIITKLNTPLPFGLSVVSLARKR